MNIQQLKSSKILLIGDSCKDIYHYGSCERISTEAPVPVYKHLRTEEKGGMAKNVYNNLVNLENEVTLITNSELITKERFVDKKTMQQLLRVDRGEEEKLKPMNLSELEKVKYDEYDGLIISDYDKGFLNHETIERILFYARKHNLPVFVDSKKKDLSCFEGCIIKINEYENNLNTKYPSEYELIVTLGKNGASWKGKTFPAVYSEIDSLSTNSSSRLLLNANGCGAGDTFLSGLVSYYLSSGEFEKSIMFANACASVVIEKFGTHSVTLEEIKI